MATKKDEKLKYTKHILILIHITYPVGIRRTLIFSTTRKNYKFHFMQKDFIPLFLKSIPQLLGYFEISRFRI